MDEQLTKFIMDDLVNEHKDLSGLHQALGNRLGNYDSISYACRRGVGNKTYLIIIYGAYNAYGLIGPECNGIAILNETDKAIVLDEHKKSHSGYENPTQDQIKEVNRLAKELSTEEFCQFVNNHPRLREDQQIDIH